MRDSRTRTRTRTRTRVTRLGGLLLVALLAGCAAAGPAPAAVTGFAADAGPAVPLVDARPGQPTIVPGDDWSLPASARPAAFSGLFSEEAEPDWGIATRSVDVSWRQLRPTRDGPLDRSAAGSAQGMTLPGLDEQLAAGGPFWLRLFASGVDWAPEWVVSECAVPSFGPDSDGQRHLPLWNDCVWENLLETHRMLLVDAGIAADPNFRFAYVPGGYAWGEYDLDVPGAAVAAGALTEAEYLAWEAHAWADLAALLPERAGRLVYTGEDYPFGPFGAADDGLAAAAVAAGLGIRSGITELSNFHLSEAPAYGSRIEADGHLTLDDGLPLHAGDRVVAAENECFTDCGYASEDPDYAVVAANLKALQLRVNWMYAVPGPSRFAELPEHWDWVRLSLGHTAASSPDAWAALREAEDTAWADEPAWDGVAGTRLADPAAWPGRPVVRNLERFLVQRDRSGAVALRSEADRHEGELGAENGNAWEGLRTDAASGNRALAFELDPRFAAAAEAAGDRLLVKVTLRDDAGGPVTLAAAGAEETIERAGTGRWVTATVALPAGAGAGFELRLAPGDDADLTARFVRVVRAGEAGAGAG